MKIYKSIMLVGFIDMLSYVIIEMLIQTFISDASFLTALSVFGIIITVLNLVCLYIAYKENLSMLLKVLLILGVAFGIYAIISINVLSFRIHMLFVGFMIIACSRQKSIS